MTKRGPYLGIDVGEVRVGLAISDPDGRVATPLATLRRGHGDIDELIDIITDRGISEVAVGLPLSLSGAKGKAALAAEDYAAKLAEQIAQHAGLATRVHLVDERLTTSLASRKLTHRGVSTRRQRAILDQLAAAEILQSWLDQLRHPGGGAPKG